MSDDPDLDLDRMIRKFGLQNALLHKGRANPQAVLGKIMGECPELRGKVKELITKINQAIEDINAKSDAEQHSELKALAPELLERKKIEKHLVLPELSNIDPSKQVVMRFAPGPSGPLHIGHTRAVILNDEYVKRYDGKFIIRFEDTNPQNIELEAYDLILEDLSWLGVKYHETYRQSDRFNTYYKWAAELIKRGNAYVCLCPVDDWRTLKEHGNPCPDRDLTPAEHHARWEQMLAREFEPGAASMVVKTDLNHPNPAVRDFVAFRMISKPHPMTKDKYYVYPTYNFSVAIDDHLMGMTHILRGKDHLNNTHRQRFVYEYLDWQVPEFMHYGWVKLDDRMVLQHIHQDGLDVRKLLKTSSIKEEIESGRISDWSDVRLGTLRALAKRGISPAAFRKYWLDIGIKEVDITFSWENLYAYNKDIIDPVSNRYFFVWDPVALVIKDVDELHGSAPLQPDDPGRGMRETVLKAEPQGIKVYVIQEDLDQLTVGDKVRLKDLGNIEITGIDPKNNSFGKYIGNDLKILKQGAKIIHWVSATENYLAEVHQPDGSVRKGYCETAVASAINTMIQFERFGFVQLGESTDPVIGWFAHK